MKLDPVDARIIVEDGGVTSLIGAAKDARDLDPVYLRRVEKSLRKLQKYLVFIAKKKPTNKSS